MSYFILADCNNFFVSCEKLFNPRLEGKAVIVLSSNDGCVVSRSQEAKKMGIKMGEPYFKIKDFCGSKVVVFSSNFKFYGDISQRVMDVLLSTAEEMEVYSIDEAFLKFSEKRGHENLFQLGKEIQRKVKRWVGIPISLGIAPTKTLAKVANDMAKKDRTIGVFDLMSPKVQKEILLNYPIGEVWGIGSRLKERLYALEIRTAWEFREADPTLIRRKMSVVGERMLWELRGISCLPLDEPAPKKSICFSRSFGRTITDLEELAEALSSYVTGACVKLRAQNSCASAITVFLEAVLDSKEGTRRHYGMTTSFPQPTNHTPQMITAAKECLKKMFFKNESYKKCGIILLDLISEELVQPDLFLGSLNPKWRKLMDTVDTLNSYYGRNTVVYGASGINPSWKTRATKKSQNYTEWKELPIVLAR
jgi:DNA polymerase V